MEFRECGRRQVQSFDSRKSLVDFDSIGEKLSGRRSFDFGVFSRALWQTRHFDRRRRRQLVDLHITVLVHGKCSFIIFNFDALGFLRQLELIFFIA